MKKDDITMLLSVITCDKCGKVMEKGESAIIVAQGPVTRSDDDLDYRLDGVHFACHQKCWDGWADTDL